MNLDPTLPELHAGDCPTCEGCGEPFCLECDMHYADCPHPGPQSEPEDFVPNGWLADGTPVRITIDQIEPMVGLQQARGLNTRREQAWISGPLTSEVFVPDDDRPDDETFDWEAAHVQAHLDGSAVPAHPGLVSPDPGPGENGGGYPHERIAGRGVAGRAAIEAGGSPASTLWRNRISGRADVDPAELIPHPENYRIHDEAQRELIAATIAEVGWVGEVYVSTFSGRLLDGHARVAEALRTGQPSIPVAYVDCDSEWDEERVLATFNTVGDLARTDDLKLLELVNKANFSSGTGAPIVRALAGLIGTSRSKPKDEPGGRIIGAAFGPQGGGSGHLGKVGGLIYPVVVECETAQEQDLVLDQATEDGHAAYAMDACPSSIGERPRD